MAASGFPGVFQAGATTGYLHIGAVQPQVTQAGFPGVFQAGSTTGYLDIGAVQKAVAVAVNNPYRMLLGIGA